uniref:Macaca fascicularis brain cDNA, clone: QflA-22417 n=1 Tax=Macaca fascicularis TaxID=9541 RepID=I7GDG5_MACFA|nr:unnamed protein product [Macaca fascicularis]
MYLSNLLIYACQLSSPGCPFSPSASIGSKLSFLSNIYLGKMFVEN